MRSSPDFFLILINWAKILGKITILDLNDAPSRNNSPITLKNVQSMMGNVTAVIVGSQALLE
jgi:hypothetical protein